jgi:hypothetical protein
VVIITKRECNGQNLCVVIIINIYNMLSKLINRIALYCDTNRKSIALDNLIKSFSDCQVSDTYQLDPSLIKDVQYSIDNSVNDFDNTISSNLRKWKSELKIIPSDFTIIDCNKNLDDDSVRFFIIVKTRNSSKVINKAYNQSNDCKLNINDEPLILVGQELKVSKVYKLDQLDDDSETELPSKDEIAEIMDNNL